MLIYGFSILLVIAVIVSKFFVNSAELELQLVNVVFRHGDRTPESYEDGELYPNDPYLNYSFPKGYGQLTNAGKMRAYNLGEHLHDLYADFLNHEYIPEEVYARSSDTDRTKMTLQLVLSSLFRPEGSDEWNPQLMWQPIPAVYCPKKLDRILKPQKSPLFGQEMSEILESPEIISRLDSYHELLENLSESTGRTIEDPLDLLNLLNTLTSEESLGLPLPPWTETVYSNGLLTNVTSTLYHLIDKNQSMKKLVSGILLRKMVDDMLNKVKNCETDEKKIYLYSAHEMNIGSALEVLGIYAASQRPQYTSAVILELLSAGNNYYVRVRYYEGIPAQSTVKTIPDCMEPCPLQKFIALIEDDLASSEEVQGYC